METILSYALLVFLVLFYDIPYEDLQCDDPEGNNYQVGWFGCESSTPPTGEDNPPPEVPFSTLIGDFQNVEETEASKKENAL